MSIDLLSFNEGDEGISFREEAIDEGDEGRSLRPEEEANELTDTITHISRLALRVYTWGDRLSSGTRDLRSTGLKSLSI